MELTPAKKKWNVDLSPERLEKETSDGVEWNGGNGANRKEPYKRLVYPEIALVRKCSYANHRERLHLAWIC